MNPMMSQQNPMMMAQLAMQNQPILAAMAAQPTKMGFKLGGFTFATMMPAGLAMPGLYSSSMMGNPMMGGGGMSPMSGMNPMMMNTMMSSPASSASPAVIDLSGIDLDAVRR